MSDHDDDAELQRGLDLLHQTWLAYRQNDAQAALGLARQARSVLGDDGEAWFALACCQERAGDLLGADRSFAQAARARFNPQPPPFRITPQRFQALIDHVLLEIPPELRGALEEVSIEQHDYATPDLVEDIDDPEILGCFVGVPRPERGPDLGEEHTPRILLFRRAHEHRASRRAELADDLRTTVLHEFGHYLGFDEDFMERYGLD